MSGILVIGGGFAGVSAAAVAADEIRQNGGDIPVTLISKDGYLTIRPRLYERDPENLRVPLRPVLEPIGVGFVEQAATAIDTAAKTVLLADGRAVRYDRLVLATGSELPPFPVPGAAEHAWNIDTYDAAVALDRHLQAVGRTPGMSGRDTVAIIGAGMTGIELAAEMRSRLAVHFGDGAAMRVRVVLIERAAAVGPEFGDNPRPAIEAALATAGVEVRLGTTVMEISADGIRLSDGERIDTATTVVTVGLRANGLTSDIPGERDEAGRLAVDGYLRAKGAADIYATGDVARAYVDDENVALMSCQHARTMGKYAGLNAARGMLGLPPRLYRQPDYTTCLDLGTAGALFTTGWDRQVKNASDEAKARKRAINTQWIYPPTGTAEEIFAGLRIDERGR
ncbi:MAG: FAD-dependent oxidoreductase [Rhodospirillaceae bacterium]